MWIIPLWLKAPGHSIGDHPNYDHILKLEVSLYGKVLTYTDWRNNKLNVSPTRVFAPNPVVTYRPGEHCKECHSVNIMYHEPWCSHKDQTNRRNAEVWTSNKHIIMRYPDRSDTYSIIEGEGLE